MKTPVMLKRFVPQGNNRGVAAIYLALMLFAMIGIVALAVDLGYKYVAWSQLQNASDSAALAGVSRLPKFPATTAINAFNNLSAARREAWRFAANNTAAKKSVFLIQSSSRISPPNNLNNGNDQNGDIVVGHWSRSGGFTPPNGVNAINAVKVVSRRIKGDTKSNVSIGDNPLPTFFGKVLGQNEMSAQASAIAAAPPGATNYILMCSTYTESNTGEGLECTSGCTYPSICPTNPTPRVLSRHPSAPNNEAFAWTSLNDNSTSSSLVSDLICGKTFPNVDLCNDKTYTTQGAETNALRDLESAMYHPTIDSSNKQFDSNGNVIGWWIIIPICDTCIPGWQTVKYHIVNRFALIHLTRVCSTGSNGCLGYGSPPGVCTNNNNMAIDAYSCMSCAQKDLFMGLKWTLVK